jgi:maltokinase
LTDTIDSLELAEDKRLSVVSTDGGLAAIPTVRDAEGQWRRAEPGDGVAEALLSLLADVPGSASRGRFTVRSWAKHAATGERSVGVDQTNESVIVGDVAVVKWATHLQDGPHPAPSRISALHDAGFGGMPAPWGLVTWQPSGGAETLVANVDEYLPGAVDGWTWAVDLITDAATDRCSDFLTAATARVGGVIAELHAALASTATVATQQDAARWRDDGLATLEDACELGDSVAVACARARRTEIEAVIEGLGALAGSPIIEGHGDLHVGQILHSGSRFVVTDFDGNPVLPAAQRMLPAPAALDVAGMSQSLAHAAIVARKYTELDAAALADADGAGRMAFLSEYARRLAELGHAELYDPAAMYAFRVQQVLREIVYATRHLPRWMYVPDAALPALLDEGTPP